MAADELTSLIETSRLLCSPANAERLLATLTHVRQDSRILQSVDTLRQEIGLGGE
jgi:antitoxin YefM